MGPKELKEQFIRWQCTVRQYSARKDQGRPNQGMRPRLIVKEHDFGNMTLMMVKLESTDLTRQFKYIYQKTQDPANRYQQAIKLLSEYYYQIPDEFSDELVAVYPDGSAFVSQIVQVGKACLIFEQGNQRYTVFCKTRNIPQSDAKYQAVYWHNRLFNSKLSGVVDMVGFTPDWRASNYMQTDLTREQ